MRDLTSILPSGVQVRFQSRKCDGSANASFPTWYVKTINLTGVTLSASGAGSTSGMVGAPGMKLFSDWAMAQFTPPSSTPSNQTALDALALQIATDFYNWASISGDEVWNGVLPLAMSALYDEVEFTHSEVDVSTRIKTAAYNAEPEELFHWDSTNSSCADAIPFDPSHTADGRPCLFYYDSAYCDGSGNLIMIRKKLCLLDGRLISTYVSTDNITAGTSTI